MERDRLDGDWDPTAYWSTTNLGEAMPGVLTPLCWALWGPASERSVRRAFHTIGVLEGRLADVPATDRERMIGIFHGRVAASVDFLGLMGDRLPGTSGAAVAEQFLGRLPADFASSPTSRRLPFVAVRLPLAMGTVIRRLRKLQAATDTWWKDEIATNPTLDLAAARAQWSRAVRWFDRTVCLQALSVFVAVQPAYDQVLQAAARAGKPELGARLLAGQGSHAELAVVEDIWRVSRDELSIEAFLAEHGYHGPGEGELSSHVWRENPGPIHAVLDQYRAKPDSERPSLTHRIRAQGRVDAERDLLSDLSGTDRMRARAALKLGEVFVPLRGTGKVAFLQSIDVARAAARRIGHHLTEQGILAHADDAFYLDADELLTAGSGRDWRAPVDARRSRRATHEAVTLPNAWRGRPEPRARLDSAGRADDSDRPPGLRIDAIGASPGVVEGTVRVVTDPTDADVDEGDILVAVTTDPAWASVMFVSGALVVDIGGLLSHAAVVARELGIPCVMGTENATERLRTGDRVRVDGTAGTVVLLQPVADQGSVR